MDEIDATAEAPQDEPADVALKPKVKKVYADGPWAIKHMAGIYKEMANDAADRLDLNVGEWLPRAIVRQIEAERATPGGLTGDVLAPGQHGGVMIVDPGPPLSLAEMREAVSLVALVRKLATDKELTATEATALRRKVYARVGLPPPAVRKPPTPPGQTQRLTHEKGWTEGQTGL